MTKTETKTIKKKVTDNGKKTKKTVDNRQAKKDRLRALKDKKSLIQKIQPDKTENTIDKLTGEMATYQQTINNRLSVMTTDRNETDALTRSHDGVLQNMQNTLQMVVNDIATINEKVGGIFDILLEPDEVEVEEETPKEKEEESDEKK